MQIPSTESIERLLEGIKTRLLELSEYLDRQDGKWSVTRADDFVSGIVDLIEEYQHRYPGMRVNFFRAYSPNWFKGTQFFTKSFWRRYAMLQETVDNYRDALRDEYLIEKADDWPRVVEFDGDLPLITEIGKLTKQLRALIRSADVSSALREKLLNHVSNIERDIQREKANYEYVLNFFLDLSVAAKEGAKNLDPILDKVQEIAATIRNKEIKILIEHEEKDVKSLPAPDDN